MSNPHEWHIASDRDGFFIEDEFGEEILPPWFERAPAGFATQGKWRCRNQDTAQSVLALVVADALENYEPPETGDAWTGGFAPNH